MRLLVVEDEPDMSCVLVNRLREENYNIDVCSDGRMALEYLLSAEYDGAIMDVMLPSMNGFEVLKNARGAGIQTPILFLTARDSADDIVRGLDLGANDYMVKPFNFEEFLARVRVLTRNKPDVAENTYCCGDLKMDCNTHEVSRAGIPISLSPREFSILLYMIRNKNIIVSRAQIEENIWSMDYDGSSNLVDVYIRYLRRKIDDNFEYKMIRTIRGAGYVLKCEE